MSVRTPDLLLNDSTPAAPANAANVIWQDAGDEENSISAHITAASSSGVYTPTRSAESNLDSNATPSEAQYIKVGTTVTVSGNVAVNPTLTATATSFELSLPVASNLGAVEDLAGVGFCGQIVGMGCAISGSVANNTAVFTFLSSDVNANTFYYTFTYQVI